MDIRYVYVKTRADFGKQCIFDVCGPNLDEEIKPNPQEMRNFIVKSPCHVGTQFAKQLALHKMQTSAIKTRNSGMYHFEGGWPREINPRDLETIARFRRRVEKDDGWAPKLRNLFVEMEHNILSNNTVNIHQHYFDDMIPTRLTQDRGMRLANMFPDCQTPPRPVNDINWSPDDTKMVVCYCFDDVQKAMHHSTVTYIWDLENPNVPYMDIEASYPTLVCQFNPRDPFVLAGGLMSGQVCDWDVRTGTEPVQVSYPRFSHRFPTNGVKWVSTKTNTEFFSSSWDGQALWWDTRNLRQPIEQLIFDLDNPNDPSMEHSIGVASSNFEPAMSTKFMFGLQNGIVISGSRKVKTNSEKLSLRFPAHSGPVVSVDRNVFIPKLFLSVGDSSIRIWAEDTREGSLMSIRSQCYLPTKACWSKARHSLFYVTRENGLLEIYDILESLKKPIVELHLSNAALTTMAAHEDGNLLAIGDKHGNVFLTESTEVLGKFERYERNNLTAGLDRNSKHVKAVDARVKEMKIIKMMEAEEVQKQPEKVVRSKKKTKQQVKIKEGKSKGKDDKATKDKSRRSTVKKRQREDAPEILVAEQVYFETLKKEREKLEADEEHELRYSTFMRNFDPKQLKYRSTDKDEKASDEEEDAKKKKGRKRKPVTAVTKKRRSLQPEELEEEKIHDVISEMLSEASAEKIAPSTKRVRKEKKRGKTKKKKFPLGLGKPCKVVCQPKVCCWRKIWPSKKATTRAGEKDQEREVSKSEESDQTQDERQTALKDKTEMLASELDKEVGIAKRELQHLKKPIDWTQRKRLVARVLEARMRTKRRPKKLKIVQSEEKVDDKYSGLGEICKKPILRTTDPCRPLGPWTFMKEIEDFLTPKKEDSKECEAQLGKADLEQLRAVQGRVYPRISDFHSPE
ncbi:hypothetical protein KPH14_008862 [Odynerus spinipes]|uniref:Dynein intermediate chain 3, ciliary n=1 Tax=Odynerus spinipes TaxID=1348599 RepID=A0AAD9R8Q4_9HYME|nr:hypothetical protein KPH14_008862 [Odynerus spinipes]